MVRRPAAPVRLPRSHRVLKHNAGGVAIYWYRCRGGPLVTKFTGATVAAALAAERDGVDQLLAAWNEGRQLPADPSTVRDLVTRYRAAPDGYLKLREGSTREKWLPWLDRIIDE